MSGLADTECVLRACTGARTVQVAERATKEDHIEQGLEKMARGWDEVSLRIEPYRFVCSAVARWAPHTHTHTHTPAVRRESGTFVLRAVDEIQSLLDDHVTLTQQMAFSAYKRPFAERIDT